MANHGFQYVALDWACLTRNMEWPYNIDRTSSCDVIQTGRYTTETPGPLPHGKCNISPSRARMDGLACILPYELPLRLEPHAGLDLKS
jgi:hypothetical protein